MNEHAKAARIEARIAPDALALVKRAAEIEGRSLSDFVVAAAQAAARRTIEDSHIVRLAEQDQLRFAEALITPQAPTDALKRAKASHQRLIQS
ncbi:uncharacterized protein (DUF1778 family) [Rhizobium aquaticum]|uniref:Uncharacterized protein (DUF1778 family) n=1 Tax=Rhizobium aquaticum TaxID=1549636 RepID=A0ABV2IXW5_9HYPH